jgi:hypothetical protein
LFWSFHRKTTRHRTASRFNCSETNTLHFGAPALSRKGRILARHGDWLKDDKRIEVGIQSLRQAAERASKDKDPDSEPHDYDFAIASAIADLRRPRWPEVAQHYERYLQITQQ